MRALYVSFSKYIKKYILGTYNCSNKNNFKFGLFLQRQRQAKGTGELLANMKSYLGRFDLPSPCDDDDCH